MSVFHDAGGSALAKAVERQVRNWELSRAQRLETPPPKRAEVEDFITISRPVGTGGIEVSTLLAERLGWPLFGREILDAMAGDDRIRRQIYDSMDERDLGWFEEAFRSLTQGQYVKNDYFHTLCETMLSLARQGHGVFLGRAADLILPQGKGLRVGFIAPMDYRIARIARLEGVDDDKAREEIERRQDERYAFVRHRFRIDPADPTRFDLVINTARFSSEQVVEMILDARKRLGR